MPRFRTRPAHKYNDMYVQRLPIHYYYLLFYYYSITIQSLFYCEVQLLIGALLFRRENNKGEWKRRDKSFKKRVPAAAICNHVGHRFNFFSSALLYLVNKCFTHMGIHGEFLSLQNIKKNEYSRFCYILNTICKVSGTNSRMQRIFFGWPSTWIRRRLPGPCLVGCRLSVVAMLLHGSLPLFVVAIVAIVVVVPWPWAIFSRYIST